MGNYDILLTVGLDQKATIKSVAEAMGIAQEEADGHVVKYKFSADKKEFLSELHNLLSQTPDLTKKVNIEFDQSGFKKGLDDLEKYAGKSARTIKTSLSNEFKNYSNTINIRDLVGAKSTGKIDGKLKEKAGEIVKELSGYMTDNKLDLSKVTNYKDLEKVVNLAKNLNAILNESKDKNIFDKSITSGMNKQIEGVKQGYVNAVSQFGTQYKQQLTDIKSNTENDFKDIFQMLIAGLSNAGEMGSELFKELGEVFKSSVKGTGEAISSEISEGIDNSKNKIKELEQQLDAVKQKKKELENNRVNNKDSLKNTYLDAQDALYNKIDDVDSGDVEEEVKNYINSVKAYAATLNTNNKEDLKEAALITQEYNDLAIKSGKSDIFSTVKLKTYNNLMAEANAEQTRLNVKIEAQEKLLEQVNQEKVKVNTGTGTTGTGTNNGTGGVGTSTGINTGTTAVNINSEQAIKEIQKIQEELNKLPETKTIDIKINAENINKIQSAMTGWNEAGNKLYDLGIGQNERFAIFNKNNGYISNSYISDAAGEISAEIIETAIQEAKGQADSMIHTHGDYGVAALSPEDVSMAITALNDGITKQYVMGLNEVSMLDLSSVSEENMLKIETEFKKKVEQIQNDAVKSLEAIGQNNGLAITALEGSDEFQNKIKDALRTTISSIGINADDVYKTMSVSDFTNSLKTEKLPTFDIELKAKLSSDFVSQVQTQLDNISPKPIVKVNAEIDEAGISRVNEQLKEIQTSFDNGLSAVATAENTSEGLKKEGKSFSEIVGEALKATQAKQDFAKANGEVLTSIINSLNGLNAEGEGFENLNKIISNLANNKDDRITDLVIHLTEIKNILSSPITGDSFIKALENIASKGDSLKDLAAVLSESEQKIKEAAKAVIQPESNTVKSFVQNSDLSRYLSDAQKFISENPVKIAAKLDEAAYKREIERIAPAIAEDFNKQYGTAIKGSDVVKAFQEIQREAEKAYQTAQREAQKAEEAGRKAAEAYYKQLQKEASQRKSDQESQQQAEINDLLSKRKQAYAEIYDIKKKVETTDLGEKELDELNKEKKAAQEVYLETTKRLKAIDQNAISEKHINDLYEIRRQAINEINQNKAHETDVNDSKKAYEELGSLVEKYVEAKKRIASGKAFENDIKDVDELESKLIDLQDKLSSSTMFNQKLEDSDMKPYYNLASELEKIAQKKKNISDKQTSLNLDKEIETNNLLKFEDELEKLGLVSSDVKEKINNLFNSIANATVDKGLSDYRKQFTLFKQEMAEPIKLKIDSNSNSEKDIKTVISDQEKAYQKIWNIKKKIASLNPEKDSSLISSLKSQQKVYYQIYNAKSNELKLLDQQISEEQRLGNIAQIRREAEEDIKNIKATQSDKDISKQVSNAVKYYSELTSLKKQLVTYETDPKFSGFDTTQITTRISTLESLIVAVRNLTDENGNLALSQEQIQMLDDALAKSELAVADAENKATVASQKRKDAGLQEQQVLEKTRAALLQQATEMSKDTKLMRAYGTQVNQFISEIQNTGTTKERLEEIRVELTKIKSEANLTGNTGKTFLEMLKGRFTSLAAYLSTFVSFYRVIGYIKSAFSTLKDLDTQLVDLRKTTTMTTSELNEFYKSSSNVAKQMGVTTSEIISQASAWSRLGYSSKEASTEMAKLSSQFASISPGMDTNSATDALVSTMQAYGIKVDEVQRKIMDNVNAIGNSMATTNQEIGDMLQRSSAAMKAANNTLEETIALESSAVEITRNAESTGTAFRTNIIVHMYSNMHKRIYLIAGKT